MPRPKLITPVTAKKVYIPTDLLAIIETLYFDPLKEKAKYGAINEYLTGLIRDDLRKRGLIA